MIASIVAATIAARNQQQQGGMRYPTQRKIGKLVKALYVLDILAVLFIIVMVALGK